MNATRRRIPSSDPKIARSTSPAGPNLSIALKTDSITKSECGVGQPLAPLLASYVTLDVVPVEEPIAQSTAVGVRGELPDLVDLRKIFAAHAKEDVAANAAIQGKSELAPARWLPGDRRSDKPAAGAGDVK